MTDEELQAIRVMVKNLRVGPVDFLVAVEGAKLIEALLNEIDRLKRLLNARDLKIKVNAILARDVYQQAQASLERLKESLPRPKDE